jgi:hypothetical protein
VEHPENAELRGNTEYVDTLAPAVLTSGPVFLSGPQRSMPEVDRNRQLGSALSLVVNSDVHDHDAVSSPDTISSLENDERLSELAVMNGVSINSCENFVVAAKVPDTHDGSLRNVDVTGKTAADISNVQHQVSSMNKISSTARDESSFNVVCHSQETPLQCLHGTFIAIHANEGDVNPRTVDAATDVARTKTAGSAAPSVNLENYARTQVGNSEE